jgi:hypothetical protein
MSDYDQQTVRIGIPQPTNIITLTQETYSVYDSSTGNPSFSNQSHTPIENNIHNYIR